MPNVISPAPSTDNLRFGIVVARWNESITRKLLDGAVTKLKEQGVTDDAIDVAWVPGSMEIPLIAQRAAVSTRYAAVLCLAQQSHGGVPSSRRVR